MIVAALCALLATAALLMRTVSLSGAISGWALATALYFFAGWRGLFLFGLLFLLATAATRIGFDRKKSLGIEQGREGRRGASNVLANSAAGLLFAFLGPATAQVAPCAIAMVAAFATAACDTVSSEIGKAYGGRTYLLTNRSRVSPGTPGGVTLAGTLFGAAAALLIALAARGLGMIDGAGILIVAIAAFAGALFESCLRARLLAGRALGSLANLINTVTGALIALGLYALAV